MLFMALIIYGVLIPGVYFASAMVAPLPKGLFLLIVPPLLYAVSILLSLFAAYLIDIYNPRVKDRMRDLLRVPGVRWSCALTAIIIALCLLVDFIWFRVAPSTLALSYLLPILIVSAVNAAGIEGNLKRLAREPAPGKAVIPDLPSGPEIAEDIVRDFRWEFKGKPYEVRLVIRRWVYDSFKSKERLLDYSTWADEYVGNGISGEVRLVSREILRKDLVYGTMGEVEFILAFVQGAIKYQTEECEYPRYPVESLADGEGDCEDYSILGATLLKSLGYDVALLILPGHAALGVAGVEGLPGFYAQHEQKRYYYCEMTGAGWKLGEIPEEYKEADVKCFPVPDLKVKVVLPEEEVQTA